MRTRHADTAEARSFRARALVLAAGTFGTARIVLRSLGLHDRPIPFLCNPYAYAPVVNVGMLGRVPRDRRHSLAQLSAISFPSGRSGMPGVEGRSVQAQLFSYRSLLTFKIMKESPLAHREGLAILRLMMPLFGILGIHHEDRNAPGRSCTLRRGSDGEADRLAIDYELDPELERRHRADEKHLLGIFRGLGCWPLRVIRPGHGSNIHYAGTFPLSSREEELTCEASGRLRGTRSVYLADGSAFDYLPPKGLTFTLMANADRVGTLLAKELS